MSFTAIYSAFERLAAAIAAVAAVLILAMSLWITYDVLARNLLGWASPWAFDLSEYALVWMTFLGAPWVLMQDRHVRIEILVDVLPARLQRLLGLVVCLVALGVCAVLTWRTGIAAIEYFERNVMMPRIWRIPRVWPYCAVPIGSGLLTAAFALRAGLYFRERDPEAVLKSKAGAGQNREISESRGN